MAMSDGSYGIKHQRFPQIKHDLIRKPLRGSGSLVVKNTATPLTEPPTETSLLIKRVNFCDRVVFCDTIKPANLD